MTDAPEALRAMTETGTAQAKEAYGKVANLLKVLVVLICVGAILSRVLPLAGINWF